MLALWCRWLRDWRHSPSNVPARQMVPPPSRSAQPFVLQVSKCLERQTNRQIPCSQVFFSATQRKESSILIPSMLKHWSHYCVRFWINVFVTLDSATYDDVISTPQGSLTSSCVWIVTELHFNHHGNEKLSWMFKNKRIRAPRLLCNRENISTWSWQGHCSTTHGHRNVLLEDLVEEYLIESWIKERKQSDLDKSCSGQLVKNALGWYLPPQLRDRIKILARFPYFDHIRQCRGGGCATPLAYRN